jgi:hypothetical protein
MGGAIVLVFAVAVAFLSTENEETTYEPTTEEETSLLRLVSSFSSTEYNETIATMRLLGCGCCCCSR